MTRKPHAAKPILLALIIGLLLTAMSGTHQSEAQDDSGSLIRIPKPGRARGRSFNQEPQIKPGPGKLVGHCTVLAGGGSMLAGPCTDLMLKLNDTSGKELLRTRTNKNGYFTFEADDKGQYLVIADSQSYEVVAPTSVVHGGQSVELQLRLK